MKPNKTRYEFLKINRDPYQATFNFFKNNEVDIFITKILGRAS